jgi:hypothetical protein
VKLVTVPSQYFYSIHGRFIEVNPSKYGESNEKCAQDKNYSSKILIDLSRIRNMAVRSKKLNRTLGLTVGRSRNLSFLDTALLE